MSLIGIRKATSIRGKTLQFRNVAITDAAFILSLRINPQKSKYLSKVIDDLDGQIAWLENYEKCITEAYFIIENLEGIPLGTVRMYDAQGDSFCWGSWIILETAPPNAAIESALLIYKYALESLGFQCAHFQIHKANERVWRFHERFGAERIDENDVQYEYRLSNAAIKSSFNRYRKYLPDDIVILETSA